ncbi:MAG: cupin domain-containing protein [Bacillota bacterium]|nr:cupin domain-containing protein [Bacillota bacterium]
MYNPYNFYPCPYFANAVRSNQYDEYAPNRTCACPYCFNQPAFNQDFSRQFAEQYHSYDDELDGDSNFDNSRPAGSMVPLRDYGPAPFVIDIDEATKRNNNYRTTLWTGKHLQLTLMSIKVKEDIGLEVHPVIDQFIRVEEGQGVVQMGPTKNNLNFRRNVSDGFAIFIPAGTWHNVINTGNRPLKLYSIYAPPQHPHGTVHGTKAIAHGGAANQER